MFEFNYEGDLKNTFNFLEKAKELRIRNILQTYGKAGVAALASATPVQSGLTASSWSYEIEVKGGTSSIYWTNHSMAGATPVVILLQYGHGTGTGGYVQGRDFINPAILPVFDKIANQVWREVTKI